LVKERKIGKCEVFESPSPSKELLLADELVGVGGFECLPFF